MTCIRQHWLLQLDNTGQDNKNMHMILWLALLVFIGVFESVVMSFLMIGHTHEDIDAMFSRWADAIDKSIELVTSPADLEAIFASVDSFKGCHGFTPMHTDVIPNVARWLRGRCCYHLLLLTNMCAIVEHFTMHELKDRGVKEGRCFSFQKSANGTRDGHRWKPI